jgi:hypothetical protein
MIFLDKQHQAMLFLKKNLFDTFPVVLVVLPQKNKTFFLLKFRSLLRGLWVLVALFYLFPVGQAFCEGDSIVQTNNKGNILNHQEKSLKNLRFLYGVAFFYGRYCRIDSFAVDNGWLLKYV